MSLDFADFIVPAAVIPDLAAVDKTSALEEMVKGFMHAGVIAREHLSGVISALFARERIAPTAIGNGIAVPHAKHPGIGRLSGLVARSREGIEFGAENGELSRVFFMILSGTQDHGRHLEALARVSRAGRDSLFTRCLMGARDSQGILTYLEKYDEERS